MARPSFKPDTSFFRKIAIGAIGARAVAADLVRLGHQPVELERGSTDTKLWKDVKRKRIRVPDLVCSVCGARIESRAKKDPEISMSHSFSDETRSWDSGMVDTDWIAFPVCAIEQERQLSRGRLGGHTSYWQERNWTDWRAKERVNYFLVKSFRENPYKRKMTKGVTEGSETVIAWDAIFSTKAGAVETASSDKVTIFRTSDGRRLPRRIPPGQFARVKPGQIILENEILASAVPTLDRADMSCPGSLSRDRLGQLILSRERTQRFTGVKLSRLLAIKDFQEAIQEIAEDPEEAAYIRLEAASYLSSTCGYNIHSLFDPYYYGTDEENRLEAVIATGEIGTSEAVSVLGEFLESTKEPFFLRSAAAWCLGRIGTQDALARLMHAFGDFDTAIREEALEGVINIGRSATPALLAGLLAESGDIAAGCAESLRQSFSLIGDDYLEVLMEQIGATNPPSWSVWLMGSLPREYTKSRIAELQSSSPHIHYALSILWSFSESWISRRWEKSPRPTLKETVHA